MSQYSVLGEAVAGNHTVLIEYSGGNPIYIGKARPGTSTSSAAWQIQKMTYAGGNMIERKWPNASSAFEFVWTSRVSYTYS